MEATYEMHTAARQLAAEIADELGALPPVAAGESVSVLKVPRWFVRLLALRSKKARLARDNGGVAIAALVIEPPAE